MFIVHHQQEGMHCSGTSSTTHQPPHCSASSMAHAHRLSMCSSAEQIEIVELLDGDVRQLSVREAAAQLSTHQQAHINHLISALLGAKEVIKNNLMKGVSWVEQKKWIALQSMNRESVREDLQYARNRLLESASLLNLSLNINVQRSLSWLPSGNDGEGAEDALQLLEFMNAHHHETDAQMETILSELQQGRNEQAQQAERMAAALDCVSEANLELQQTIEEIVRALASQPTTAASPVHCSFSRMEVPEFVTNESLKISDEVLGRGSTGRVLKAQYMKVVGTGVWIDCAFKEVIVEHLSGISAKDRKKKQATIRKALRKEAQVMWILNGQPISFAYTASAILHWACCSSCVTQAHCSSGCGRRKSAE